MYVKGSYTLEASFILPIVLIIYMISVSVAINLYSEEKALVKEQSAYETIEPVKTIRQGDLVDAVIDLDGEK